MNVYCVQLDIVWEDKSANFSRVRSLVRSASVAPRSLIVLPEMFATGFSMSVEAIHETSPSATEAFLAELAKESQSCVLAGLVARQADGRGLNQAVAVSPQGAVEARYTKMQPFSLGGESKHYAAGEDVVAFSWQEFRWAPFICYDLRFPELFRAAARRGAQAMAVIANWPEPRTNHWVTLLQARAIENQAYVVGVNRCGADAKLAYRGRSMVIDPKGAILADAGESEGVAMAEIQPAAVEGWRADFPALQDMRSDVA